MPQNRELRVVQARGAVGIFLTREYPKQDFIYKARDLQRTIKRYSYRSLYSNLATRLKNYPPLIPVGTSLAFCSNFFASSQVHYYFF